MSKIVSQCLMASFLVIIAGCLAEPEPTSVPSFTPVPTWTSTPVIQIQKAAETTPEPFQKEANKTSSSNTLEWPFGLQPPEKVVIWAQDFYEGELRAGFLDEQGGKGMAVLLYPAMFDLLQGPCRGDIDDLGRTLKFYFENPYAIRKYGEIDSALEYPSGYLPYIILMLYVSSTIGQESDLSVNEDIRSVPADTFDCDQILRDMDLVGIEAMVDQMNERIQALEAEQR
ncbi:MAG: hypothetical protein OXI80_22045 [Caldilineaceae bacterium]|nr:hypothetical protein [Caldilineaceae bacterium]MDE0340365.1 hypothetical protein [Caldilineaceae bacterium]